MSSGSPIPVRLRGVTKRYGSTTAVSDLDLEVNATEVLALLGPNGAGKTTAIRCITGMLKPDAGSVRVLGGPPGSADDRVGLMPQSLGAWSALYFAINYFLQLEEQNDRMLRLEAQAASAQLAMLRYQLNPHFLFNSLTSIRSQIPPALGAARDQDQAGTTLGKLSGQGSTDATRCASNHHGKGLHGGMNVHGS